MKHSASRPKTPSTDTTSGVNEALRASLYFLFFSSSADDRTEATSRCKYDGASVSMTRMSNNATIDRIGGQCEMQWL